MKTSRFPWEVIFIGMIMLTVALLSSCTTTGGPTIPTSLLTCPAEPVATSAWKSQRDVGKFLVRVAEAGEDCRTKLGAVKKIVEPRK